MSPEAGEKYSLSFYLWEAEEMTLVSSVWREVTQKLELLKALIGFCTIAWGKESKRKSRPRTRGASRLNLAGDEEI